MHLINFYYLYCLEILDLLLEAGADFDKISQHGWTPLRWAAHRVHRTVMKDLLIAGSSIEGSTVSDKIDRILEVCNVAEKITILANLIAQGMDLLVTLNKTINDIWGDNQNIETASQITQNHLELCKESKILRPKTKITDSTKDILYNLWNQLDKIEQRFYESQSGPCENFIKSKIPFN